MKTNEQLKSNVAEWEQAIIGAAGEESYEVVDDKQEGECGGRELKQCLKETFEDCPWTQHPLMSNW